MSSNYRIGIGISEVTDTAIGLQMQGFADDRQKTGGVELPLFSRAFMVEDQGTGKRVVIVSAEIWAATNAVTQEVLKRLQAQFTTAYTKDNVLISGTHTHSAPGGYDGYRLYDLTGKGFDEHTFECIVSGIVTSIRNAHDNLGPGNIYLNKGVIADCGRNRSLAAYNNNRTLERARYPADTDREMLLLRFTKRDSGGKERPIGVLSWFAIHPTDRGQQNQQVCGDNKGFASFLFENDMNPLSATETFVAAFANANAGDVSGNVEYNRIPNGTDDVQHMERHGMIQYRMAKRLFESASEELSGSIDYRHKYVDMSNVQIGEWGRTWPAALGLSFAAGSTEDGVPEPLSYLKEGISLRGDIIPTEWFMHGLATLAGKIVEQLPTASELGKEVRDGHFPKPILFAVGANEGLAPKILPLQILKIGQLVILGVPAELTTMAGRRLRESVLRDLVGVGVQHVAIAGYANDYSQYVTTEEEYDMQHYEGASTLFGRFTLLAYVLEFRKLSDALRGGGLNEPGPTPPGNSSPTARRWTFRNLSAEDIKLYYYYQMDTDRVDFKDQSTWLRHADGDITIPADREIAIPQRRFSDGWNTSGRTKAALSIAGTNRDFTIDKLVTITKEKSTEVTEYTPPAHRGYTPGGLLQIISSRSQKGIGGYNLMDGCDQAFALDYTGSGKLDHLFFYRPGSGMFSIVTCKQGQFLTVYKASDVKANDDGLTPFWFLRFSNIRGFAFDYLSQGRLDHVAFYAPGQKVFTIAKRHDYDWQGYLGPITQSCDMSDPNDKAFAFDYGNGYVNHVVVYRPGTGKIGILGLSSDGGHYEEKWQSQKGIAGFDLLDKRDLGLAFDYEQTGKLDDLVFYRPGTGIMCIIKKDGNQFRLVYDSRESKVGIGRWNLSSPLDRIIAFDLYDQSSEPGQYYHDRLVCYRPGTGMVQIIEKVYGGLELTAISWSNGLVTATTTTTHGVQVGQELQIGYVRPPSYNGTFQALAGTAGNTLVYALATNPGRATFLGRGGGSRFMSTFVSDTGIGTYDLKGVTDQILAFDYKDDATGKMAATSSGPSELFLFRPGSGVAFIAQSRLSDFTDTVFVPAYWYSGLHWPKGRVTIGVYRLSESIFYLRNSNSGGAPDITFKYGDPGVYVPIVGDWTGKGYDTIGVFRPKESGVYRPSESAFLLKNSNSAGGADNIFQYGSDGDVPIVGDWTGKGHDSIGVYRPSESTFYLRNSNSAGAADMTFQYGARGDVPIVGDWTGKGYDSFGVYRPSESTFYLRNSNTGGAPDITFQYGARGDVPIVGDWTGKGYDSFGVYRPSESTFYLRNSNTGGAPDITFQYGARGDVPIVGEWRE